jgi:hypothetical protein
MELPMNEMLDWISTQKQKTFFVLTFNELDNLIHTYYGITEDEYEFVADAEAHNDSAYTFNVVGILTEYEEKDIKNNASITTAARLNDMCKAGIIPKGDYLIDVRW